jgi:DNA polymerase I-like protein with 3'-5' exonuclease and polymerase domains
MFIPAGKRYLFDIETTGLLDYLIENRVDTTLSRVHILAIRDLDTRQTFVFRQNKRMNTIPRGIAMLNEADVLVGHNIIEFDIPVLELFYPEFQVNALVRDTMVLSRVFFADEKERDFRRWKRGELDGEQIGRHGLEAWGQRMGENKGDYSKSKAAEIEAQYPHLTKTEITRMVWAEWCQDMEDYCVQDLNVNEHLWHLMVANPRRHSDTSITLEHRVHALMAEVTNNGFPFDVDRARVLETELRAEVEVKEAKAVEHFGSWWVPSKRKVVGKEYTVDVSDENGYPVLDAKGKPQKTKSAFRVRPELGEDNSRAEWGEVIIPKKSVKYKDPMKGDRMEGCGYCPVELKEFNPGSRHQIIDRLKFVYQWEPQEFTETGQPAVNDEVLRDLAHTIPICDELAELFYYNKRLGQLVDGKNGWIGKALLHGDYRIHPKFNVGGTVTNRASHSDPNIAQVPRVVFKKLAQWVEEGVVPRFRQGKIIYGIPGVDADGNATYDENLTPLLGPDGKQLFGPPKLDAEGAYLLDAEGKVETKKQLLKGRIGDHGWDSRDLFYVPEGWVLMGADQKGIELRALGHYMAEYDDGVYGRLVVESDPHDLHTAALELQSRDTAKTFIYALIYGAQDFKLGTVIDPALAMKPQEAKRVGAEMRRRLMTRIPALGQVVKNIQRQAKSGMLDALDGRRLFVRAQHAALNTLLQGAGATIAKQWCVNFAEYCEEDGLVHGWEGDFAIVAWIHDELQVAVRDDPKIIEICQRNIISAAYDAGMTFGFRLPVDVDVKFGRRWSDTH